MDAQAEAARRGTPGEAGKLTDMQQEQLRGIDGQINYFRDQVIEMRKTGGEPEQIAAIETSMAAMLVERAKVTGQPVRMSNGTESLYVQPDDVAAAQKDGFKVTL